MRRGFVFLDASSHKMTSRDMTLPAVGIARLLARVPFHGCEPYSVPGTYERVSRSRSLRPVCQRDR